MEKKASSYYKIQQIATISTATTIGEKDKNALAFEIVTKTKEYYSDLNAIFFDQKALNEFVNGRLKNRAISYLEDIKYPRGKIYLAEKIHLFEKLSERLGRAISGKNDEDIKIYSLARGAAAQKIISSGYYNKSLLSEQDSLNKIFKLSNKHHDLINKINTSADRYVKQMNVVKYMRSNGDEKAKIAYEIYSDVKGHYPYLKSFGADLNNMRNLHSRQKFINERENKKLSKQELAAFTNIEMCRSNNIAMSQAIKAGKSFADEDLQKIMQEGDRISASIFKEFDSLSYIYTKYFDSVQINKIKLKALRYNKYLDVLKTINDGIEKKETNRIAVKINNDIKGYYGVINSALQDSKKVKEFINFELKLRVMEDLYDNGKAFEKDMEMTNKIEEFVAYKKTSESLNLGEAGYRNTNDFYKYHSLAEETAAAVLLEQGTSPLTSQMFKINSDNSFLNKLLSDALGEKGMSKHISKNIDEYLDIKNSIEKRAELAYKIKGSIKIYLENLREKNVDMLKLNMLERYYKRRELQYKEHNLDLRNTLDLLALYKNANAKYGKICGRLNRDQKENKEISSACWHLIKNSGAKRNYHAWQIVEDIATHNDTLLSKNIDKEKLFAQAKKHSIAMSDLDKMLVLHNKATENFSQLITEYDSKAKIIKSY